MKPVQGWLSRRNNPRAVMSLALVRYNFSTPEIRMLMRQALGHAVSGRTIKRLVRAKGGRLKRGRPPTTSHIPRARLANLLALTSHSDLSECNALRLFQDIQIQFGLTPRQYIKWLSMFVRRGKFLMRRC